VAFVSTTAGSLLFGLVFIRWRSVPAAAGVHAAWNWPGEAIAGLEVQGPQFWAAPPQWQVAQAVYVAIVARARLAAAQAP
jgi:membrane protease YdiL (CAAX protease family)